MIKIVDQDHPFYKPLWRRLALIAAIGVWAFYEIAFVRDPMWMVLTGGLFVYAVWNFIVIWPRADQTKADAPSEPTDKDATP